MGKENQNLILWCLIVFVILFSVFGGFGMMGGYGMMGFGMGFGLIAFLALIGFVFWLVINLQDSKGSDDTPLSILKKRYAKGEISKKEYEYMKKELVE